LPKHKTIFNKMNKLKNKNKLNYSEWCSINSYKGWVKHYNAYNLEKQYLFPLEKKSKNIMKR